MNDLIKAACRMVYELDLQYECGTCYYCDSGVDKTFDVTEWPNHRGEDYFRARSAWEKTLIGGMAMSHNILHQDDCPLGLAKKALSKLGYDYTNKP